jgi:hypothetical protein
MKVFLKSLWALLIVPPLIFLKGDLSMKTMFDVYDLNSVDVVENRISIIDGNEPSKEFEVPVQVLEADSTFSGDGMVITLYDQSYGILERSQIIQGRVKFRLKGAKSNHQKFILVSNVTMDEMSLDISKQPNTDTLFIHASQIPIE